MLSLWTGFTGLKPLTRFCRCWNIVIVAIFLQVIYLPSLEKHGFVCFFLNCLQPIVDYTFLSTAIMCSNGSLNKS